MPKTPRDHIVSLRLTADERAVVTRGLGDPANLSEAVRTALLAHVREPAICNISRPGTWASSAWVPFCQLPAGHRGVPHWWRHEPSGHAETWEFTASGHLHKVTMLSGAVQP